MHKDKLRAMLSRTSSRQSCVRCERRDKRSFFSSDLSDDLFIECRSRVRVHDQLLRLDARHCMNAMDVSGVINREKWLL